MLVQSMLEGVLNTSLDIVSCFTYVNFLAVQEILSLIF